MVAELTRNRVLEAARAELRAQSRARALITGRTGLIA